MAIPPSSTPPLRDPASRRTAECVSRCQGEESSARASSANVPTSRVAAKPTTARIGTMTVMRRLYRLVLTQTIELLVMGGGTLDRLHTHPISGYAPAGEGL